MKKGDRSEHLMKPEDIRKKLCESLKIDPEKLAKIGENMHDAGRPATQTREHDGEER